MNHPVEFLKYINGCIVKFFRHVRECLKLDPEHKDCFPHYKKVKKIDKLMNQMNSAVGEKDYGNCIEFAKKVRLKFLYYNSFTIFTLRNESDIPIPQVSCNQFGYLAMYILCALSLVHVFLTY